VRCPIDSNEGSLPNSGAEMLIFSDVGIFAVAPVTPHKSVTLMQETGYSANPSWIRRSMAQFAGAVPVAAHGRKRASANPVLLTGSPTDRPASRRCRTAGGRGRFATLNPWPAPGRSCRGCGPMPIVVTLQHTGPDDVAEGCRLLTAYRARLALSPSINTVHSSVRTIYERLGREHPGRNRDRSHRAAFAGSRHDPLGPDFSLPFSAF